MAGEPTRTTSSRAVPGLVLVYAPDLAGRAAGDRPRARFRHPRPRSDAGGVALPLTSVSRVHARVSRKATRARSTIWAAATACSCVVRRSTVPTSSTVSTFASGRDLRLRGRTAPTPSPRHARLGRHGSAVGPRSHRGRTRDPPACSTTSALSRGPTSRCSCSERPARARSSSRRRSTKRAAARARCALSLARRSRRTSSRVSCSASRRAPFTGADRDSPPASFAQPTAGRSSSTRSADLPLELQPKFLRLLESSEGSRRSGRRRPRASTCASSAPRTRTSTSSSRRSAFAPTSTHASAATW